MLHAALSVVPQITATSRTLGHVYFTSLYWRLANTENSDYKVSVA